MKDIIILGIAIWLIIELPNWSKKLVPKQIKSWKIPGILRFISGCGLAYAFASIGWGKIAKSVDMAFMSLVNVAKAEQVINVVEIPRVLLAIVAIVLPILLFDKIFKSLDESANIKESLIALGIVFLVLFAMSKIWSVVEAYIMINLAGAQKVIETEAFKEIDNFLSK